MTLYEVNLQVDVALRDDYLIWLRAHVREMLAFDGFIDATLADVSEPAPAPGCFALCVRYCVRDAASLQAYFDQHAPRMRAEGIARFGDGFSTSRRILTLLD